MRFRLIPIFLFLLPLLEIAGFVIVGRQIGVLPTLGLVIASGFAGAILLRVQGLGSITRIRSELEAGRDPSRALAHGLMILVAAILLLIPGFVTDILGLLLFLAPARDIAWTFLRSRIRFVGPGPAAAGWRPAGRGKTIDLDEGDYSSGGEPGPSRRKIDSD